MNLFHRMHCIQIRRSSKRIATFTNTGIDSSRNSETNVLTLFNDVLDLVLDSLLALLQLLLGLNLLAEQPTYVRIRHLDHRIKVIRILL